MTSPTAKRHLLKKATLIHKIVRHVDAGYEEAIEFDEMNGVKIPLM